MMLSSDLEQVLMAQQYNLSRQDIGLKRTTLQSLPDLSTHALIISGIRRCGKSTLLHQLLANKYPKAVYLNFEDPRLYNFENTDFPRLDEIIKKLKTKAVFFDEIQIIPQWERYIRQKLDEGFKVVITGSNASLLSRELGTKLTGRHIMKELFPFSYSEFLSFHKLTATDETLLQYMATGGFPEYVKVPEADILHQLFDDILVRDIAVRYGVRDIKILQRLALYLVTNTSKLITGNRLKSLFEIGATSTVMEYLSHLESAWLFQFVPKFSHSMRKQLINPRKVYAIDTGLVEVNSGSFSDDKGRKFENLVYLHLRRQHSEIFYFAEKGECDFVVAEKGKIKSLVQVCADLTADNLDREMNGLTEAMDFFELKTGTIVTLKQNDHYKKDGKNINVVKASDFMK